MQDSIQAANGNQLSATAERRISVLESRMDNIEQQITASTAAPSRRLLSPEIEWLRENRTQIREKYAGKWIAVLGASLLGNSDSLKDLHAEMKARNINNASFVHVSEPLAPQS